MTRDPSQIIHELALLVSDVLDLDSVTNEELRALSKQSLALFNALKFVGTRDAA